MSEEYFKKLKEKRLIVKKLEEDAKDYYIVQPTPGVVVKFKKARLMFTHDSEVKCFLNIAHCIEMPFPDVDEDEKKLAEMMRVDEKCFQLPLSLGELDCVEDHTGLNSLKFDCVINSDFFHKRFQKSEFHRQLVIAACIGQIEQTHQVAINRSSQVVLRNKKSIGIIEPHRIPRAPKNPSKKHIFDLTAANPVGTHQHENVTIWIEKGTLLKATIAVSEVVCAADLRLKANRDHIVLFIKGTRRVADFFVPVDLDVDSLEARILDGEGNQSVVEVSGKFSLFMPN